MQGSITFDQVHIHLVNILVLFLITDHVANFPITLQLLLYFEKESYQPRVISVILLFARHKPTNELSVSFMIINLRGF